ncbi:MAG: hypothetical protein M2R45_00553 [Verrucomicrobia subdivision 3 bacterium]|nr:hypothetical protein [Limisphaerales bacterium]MCS1413569.1 hypothetical protein [Limisphaerales bacterium]
MVPDSHSSTDHLWTEYSEVFKDLDDLTLGRWMAQTLGQLRGRVWRLSHPLLGTYWLASQTANKREIWQKRFIAMPHGYHAADCCSAPIFPLFSRDVADSGLICEHCGESAVAFADLPEESKNAFEGWSKQYHEVHQVAHWSEKQKEQAQDYQQKFETAAKTAEQLLNTAATELLPPLLDHFPTILWEDQDECLDVQPEDIGPN